MLRSWIRRLSGARTIRLITRSRCRSDPVGDVSDAHDRQPMPSAGLVAMTTAWALVVSSGLLGFAIYMNTPGTPARVPDQWPVASKLQLHDELPTLVYFVHPHCACTRVSTGELEPVLVRNQQGCYLQSVIVQPRDADRTWSETQLVEDLKQLPGSSVRMDPNGTETRRFGVSTSGHVLVYSTQGKLLFSGGVTASRGQAGDNWGKSTLDGILSNRGNGSTNCESC